MHDKKLPIRMCCGCGEHILKKELLRIVRGIDGKISIDATGKMSGRGAYICPKLECLEKAIKSRRLEKNLSSKIADEVFKQLREELVR